MGFVNYIGLGAQHFFDVPVWEQLLRLLGAMLIGGIFGFEREMKSKPAGFITFMIVSMGGCLFSLLQLNIMNMVNDAVLSQPDEIGITLTFDSTRLIAQVISGVGFLGAGTIIFNKGSIKGITTAAMIWVAAGIGLLIGMGGMSNYIIAASTAIIYIPISMFMRRYGRIIADKYKVHRLFISYEEVHEADLYDILNQSGATIKKTFFHNKSIVKGVSVKEVYIYFKIRRGYTFDGVLNSLSNNEWVNEVEDL